MNDMNDTILEDIQNKVEKIKDGTKSKTNSNKTKNININDYNDKDINKINKLIITMKNNGLSPKKIQYDLKRNYEL